ncbi:MAG: hypothetical protein O6846_01795, partial [Thaumarchaeota archaeon]|nr:hypothetical protein [Nitrososphaerota archaeon]
MGLVHFHTLDFHLDGFIALYETYEQAYLSSKYSVRRIMTNEPNPKASDRRYKLTELTRSMDCHLDNLLESYRNRYHTFDLAR